MENPLALVLDGAKAVTGRFISVSSGNLLNNPSFEDAAGTNGNGAAYWEAGVPDDHGERWGSAARVAWRPTDGSWHGAICGTWSNSLDYGGFWQEVPAVPGRDYVFGGGSGPTPLGGPVPKASSWNSSAARPAEAIFSWG